MDIKKNDICKLVDGTLVCVECVKDGFILVRPAMFNGSQYVYLGESRDVSKIDKGSIVSLEHRFPLSDLDKQKANIVREGLILSLKAKLMDALANKRHKGIMSELGNYCSLGALSCRLLEVSRASDEDILNNKIDVE